MNVLFVVEIAGLVPGGNTAVLCDQSSMGWHDYNGQLQRVSSQLL